MEPAQPSPRAKGGKKLNFAAPPTAVAAAAASPQREKQLLLLKRTKSGLVTPLERLEHAYEEKDAEARLAAQIGQELIEKVKSDQALIEELKSAIRTLYQQMDQLETQMRGLRSAAPEASASAAEKESNGRLDSIAELITALRRAVAAAEASNDRLLQDVRDRDARLQANISELRERDALRARYSALSEELEVTKAELLEVRKALNEARGAHKQTVPPVATKEHSSSHSKESEHNPQLEAKLAKQREELAELRSELTAREQQIQQLHLENSKLAEGMAQLTRDNHSVRREAAELSGLLEQTRSELVDLRDKLEEAQLRNAAPPIGGSLEDSLRDAPAHSASSASASVSASSSVFTSTDNSITSASNDHSLAAELATTEPILPPPSPIAAASPSAVALVLSSVPLVSPRKPPAIPALPLAGLGPQGSDAFNIEEFFFLSAIAIKIDLAIKHAEHSDLVFRMDADALYREVIKQQIPFHEWYSFIVVTFLSLLADMIEQRHKEEQQRFLLHRLVQRKVSRADFEEALKAAPKEQLDREDVEGRTPLIVAVHEKQSELVQALLAAGADPSRADRARNTPLLIAAEHEDLKIAEILLKVSDLTLANASGSTLVHTLVRNQRNQKGAIKIIKMLLQGLPLSEFERKDEQGCTPLFLACTQLNPSMELIQMLMKAKCNIDAQNQDGRTALLVAAAMGNSSVVKILLEAGANVEHRDKTGRSVIQHSKPDSAVANTVKSFLRDKPGGERALRHLVDDEWTVILTINDLPRGPRKTISDLPEDILTAHWPTVLNALNFAEKCRFVPSENEAQKRRQKTREEQLEAQSPPAPHDTELITPGNPHQLLKHMSQQGHGAFGKVFHALMGSGATKLPVAVKKVAHSNPADQKANLQEVRILRQCSHKNVVTLTAAYAAPGELWMVMEFMEGGTLAEAADKSALAETHIAFIVREVLTGLAYIHQQRVIHRDIKASNIMLSVSAEVKIIDFGIAFQLSDDMATVRGMAGSAYWMAPEVTKKELYGTRADIWSLGMLLIEMCDTEPYLHRQPVAALLTCALDEFSLPEVDNPSNWPQELLNFLRRCLVRKEADRPTAVQLLEDPFLKMAASKEEMHKLMRALFMYQGLKEAGFGL